MITRLQVSGFKNLVDVAVDLGPYTCIAGPNGVGKSNLFDAIAFLSSLADNTLLDAAQRVRGGGRRLSDIRDLFWDRGGDWRDSEDPEVTRRMDFKVEMIVPRDVVDDFGRVAKASITFLEYELRLGYVPPSEQAGAAHIRLMKEQLQHIPLNEANRHLRFPHSVAGFRRSVVTGRRTAEWLISTVVSKPEAKDQREEVVIRVHQDGGSRGNPKPWSARRAQRTIVGTTGTTADPTILACRREMQRWRRLALEPAAMREPSEWTAPSRIGEDGSNLASTLYRLANPPAHDSRGERRDLLLLSDGGGQPGTSSGMHSAAESVESPASLPSDGVYARIAARLSALVGLREISVDRDERRELYTVVVAEGDLPVPARALSDGTLRFLALCVLQEDTEAGGLLCMEEPENGIHPQRLEAMADLVRSLAVDPSQPIGAQNPFRQVIVNTHSPGFLRLQSDGDLLLADASLVRRTGGAYGRALRIQPCAGSWRARPEMPGVPRAVIRHLLEEPSSQRPLFDPAP